MRRPIAKIAKSRCPVAHFIWCVIECALGVRPNKNIGSMFGQGNFLGNNTKNLVLVGVAAVLWILWKARNRACFDRILPTDPTELIFTICFTLGSWSILQIKEADREKVLWGAQLLKQIANGVFHSRFG